MRSGGLWRRIKRVFGLTPPEPPAADPPDEEPALVPAGPPRPVGAGGVALALPEEPQDVDARGREVA